MNEFKHPSYPMGLKQDYCAYCDKRYPKDWLLKCHGLNVCIECFDSDCDKPHKTDPHSGDYLS